MSDNSQPLARVGDRRRRSRRAADAAPSKPAVIASHWAFSREERRVLKALERRRSLRRDDDTRSRVRSL